MLQTEVVILCVRAVAVNRPAVNADSVFASTIQSDLPAAMLGAFDLRLHQISPVNCCKEVQPTSAD